MQRFTMPDLIDALALIPRQISLLIGGIHFQKVPDFVARR
jgi:hypothetical protein